MAISPCALSLLMLMCSDQMATFAHVTYGSSMAHILWYLTSFLESASVQGLV